jgi:hypothetical protein
MTKRWLWLPRGNHDSIAESPAVVALNRIPSGLFGLDYQAFLANYKELKFSLTVSGFL